MSVGTITVQTVVVAGIATTSQTPTATDGDKFLNDGRTILEVFNGSAAPITVSVNSLVNCNQGFDHNISVTVANGARACIGPFPTQRFNDSTGYVTAICSAVTDITIAALKIP